MPELIIILLLILNPKYLAFSVKALAVFIIVRSAFISMTHLGVNPHELSFDTQSVGFSLYNTFFNTKNDFFFSGHTGIPFLMALVFWHDRFWQRIFLVISTVLGTSVLFAHIHYSIDVFASPFIAYGIFAFFKYVFSQDYKLIAAIDMP